MDIKEIRVGCYYYFNHPQIEKKNQIVMMTEKLLFAMFSNPINYGLQYYSPIPLSEEILLKANYKDLKGGEFLSEENLFFIYKGDDGKFEIFLYQYIQDDVYLKHIQYLHELQNLHFDLGQELEIKL